LLLQSLDRPLRRNATPEKIKSGRKTGKTPSKDHPYRAILRRWAFRPETAVRGQRSGNWRYRRLAGPTGLPFAADDKRWGAGFFRF
jgi:hypothetical protein